MYYLIVAGLFYISGGRHKLMDNKRSIISEAVSKGRSVLSEYESKTFLASLGIPFARDELVDSLSEAENAAGEIGYPVVLKVCSERAVHKTDKGLIKTGIRDREELAPAFESLFSRAGELEGAILVQEMIRGERELVMGMTRKENFGPCVMFGLGGIFTEALEAVSFRVAPFDEREALDMMNEIPGRKILNEFRGMAPVDRERLASYLVSLGKIGLEYPEIREIDVNPMIVRDGQPVAVDALVVLEAGLKTPETVSLKAESQPAETSNTEYLKKFFEPENVAVIGASGKPHKAGNDVVLNITANGYKGGLYLVNPRGGEILGHKVYTSIEELPPGIDLGIVILPASATPETIRKCAARGITALVLAAGGFAEVDEQGRSLQDETVKAIRETGVRVLGPNTSGHTSTQHNFTSSFFPLGKIPRGNISYIAQTGNFATHTMRYIMSGEHFGVALVAGMGNKLDIEESELLEYYAGDPETSAIFIYLESFKYPGRFLETARRVTKKKPVILFKGGMTSEGAKAAVAHTAAIASDNRIIDGLLRQAGVVRIHRYSHLFLAAKAAAVMPLPSGNRVSFLAPSGAMLVSLTDFCTSQLELEVPDLEESSRRRLQDLSPDFIRMRNPVDIWATVLAKGMETAYYEGAKIVLSDPNIDAAVLVLMLSDEIGVPPLDFIVDLAGEYPQKPVYVTFSAQKKHMDAARDFLEPRGVPTFPLIEQPFEVLDILHRCRAVMEKGR
jgi:acyl-CoA synthetase (NDP forming)